MPCAAIPAARRMSSSSILRPWTTSRSHAVSMTWSTRATSSAAASAAAASPTAAPCPGGPAPESAEMTEQNPQKPDLADEAVRQWLDGLAAENEAQQWLVSIDELGEELGSKPQHILQARNYARSLHARGHKKTEALIRAHRVLGRWLQINPDD